MLLAARSVGAFEYELFDHGPWRRGYRGLHNLLSKFLLDILGGPWRLGKDEEW